jgi:stringent starvation protein B
MNAPLSPDSQGTSTRPYLIRALHDWCTDNGFTPYVAVHVDARVQVPMEYVKNNEIVLNVGFEATSGLKLGNEFIEFKARFGGVGRDIVVPIDHVVAIYARENGQGMAFPLPNEAGGEGGDDGSLRGSGASPSLRLAAVDAAESTEAGDASAASMAVDDTTPDDEPPPSTPSGPRPALKRVK